MLSRVTKEYLASLRPSTAHKQEGVLRSVVPLLKFGQTIDTLDWASVRPADLELLQRKLSLRNKPSTVRTKMAIVRSVMRRAFAAGEGTAQAYEGMRQLRKLPKSSRGKTGRMLQPEEFARIWPILDGSTARGRLERAVLFALATTGMRVSELCALRTEDFCGEIISITSSKTYRERDVRASEVLKVMLAAHTEDHDPRCEYLFQNMGVGFDTGQLNRDKVAHLLEQIAKRADLETFTPHDMRRTTASSLLANGVDVCTVADVLGHTSVDTTRSYDRRSETQRIGAFEKLSNLFEEKSDERRDRREQRRASQVRRGSTRGSRDSSQGPLAIVRG